MYTFELAGQQHKSTASKQKSVLCPFHLHVHDEVFLFISVWSAFVVNFYLSFLQILGEENVLSWEKFPYSALSKTYNTDRQTSDSAGTATAFITGVKSRGGKLLHVIS